MGLKISSLAFSFNRNATQANRSVVKAKQSDIQANRITF